MEDCGKADYKEDGKCLGVCVTISESGKAATGYSSSFVRFGFHIYPGRLFKAVCAGCGTSGDTIFFAFQMDDGITRMLFYFGVVLLFCNAPFMDDQQMFVLVRTGRLRWFAGQLAYIVAANLVYFLWTALTTVLVLIPQVGFSTDWGGIIRMCAENNGLAGVVMHKEIVEAYTPLAACLITYGLNVLVGTLLGLVVFLGNMLGSRIYGSAVAIGWIVFSNMIDVVRLPKLRVLSPLHWTTTYAYLRSDDAVPLWYILAVEIAIILVTGFIIMKNRRHTHLTLLSQAYRTFAEGREDLENGKFDRNTGCRKKVRGTDGSGPCEPFCHTRKNIWNHRKERKRQDSSF